MQALTGPYSPHHTGVWSTMNSAQGRNTMMSMLNAQPEEQQGRNGEYWTDDSDHLSPIRKHLISTYLQVTDEESMPLLGEYFGVALSFVALGALVRAYNASKRRQRKLSDDERLDLRSCSRFQRMALESMVRESMERLRNLSQNAHQLEERARHLVAENFAQDRERFELMERLMDADKSVQELLALRKAEARANEKVMSIVASKEQDWIKEKRGLLKEMEILRGTIKGLTREAKLQARRCREPACDHCRGINKGLKTNALPIPKGRMSLRDLHSLRDSGPPVYELPKVGRKSPEAEKNQDDEEDGFLLKSIGLKSFSEKLGQSKADRKGERSDQQGSSKRMGTSGEGSTSGSGLSPVKDGPKEQQDMESELASILKRVGMLKQRSFSTGGVSERKEQSAAAAAGEGPQRPVDGTANAETLKDEGIRLPFSPEKQLPEERSADPSHTSFEAAEYASEHNYNAHDLSALELPPVESSPTIDRDSQGPEEDLDDGDVKSEMIADKQKPGSMSPGAGNELPETTEGIQRSLRDEAELAMSAGNSPLLTGAQSAEVAFPINKDSKVGVKGLSSSEEDAASIPTSTEANHLGMVDEESRGSKEVGDTEADDDRGQTVNTKVGEAETNGEGEVESMQKDVSGVKEAETNVECEVESMQKDVSGVNLHEIPANDSTAGSDYHPGSPSRTQRAVSTQPPDTFMVDIDHVVSEVKNEGDHKRNGGGADIQSNLGTDGSSLNSGGQDDDHETPKAAEQRNDQAGKERSSVAVAVDHGGQKEGDLLSGGEKLKPEKSNGDVGEQEKEEDQFFDSEE